MGSPYIGEIRMFGGNFAPAGWAFCDGSLLAISEYDALFSLIGTTYGGDGQNTFALPDLRSRVPLHMGSASGSVYVLGQNGGEEQVTLVVSQLPAHSHATVAYSGSGSQTSPQGNVWAQSANLPYSANQPASPMDPAAVGPDGGNQPHDNMVPFVGINFIISLFGVYPSVN